MRATCQGRTTASQQLAPASEHFPRPLAHPPTSLTHSSPSRTTPGIRYSTLGARHPNTTPPITGAVLSSSSRGIQLPSPRLANHRLLYASLFPHGPSAYCCPCWPRYYAPEPPALSPRHNDSFVCLDSIQTFLIFLAVSLPYPFS